MDMNKKNKESKMSIFEGTSSIYSTSSESSEDSFFDESDNDSYDDTLSLAVLFTAEENAIDFVLNNEAYCFNFEKFSSKLVNSTYVEAYKHVKKVKKAKAYRPSKPLDQDCNANSESSQNSTERPSYTSNNPSSVLSIDWPKISEFNIKLGLEKLEDYVATWKRSSSWSFCVEFLGFESEDCSNIFIYEIEWSKPKNLYPIPQATASVYFALEVLKMVPYNHDRNIEVSYVFECSNVIHVPGKINFQEKWLDAIIQAKLKSYKFFTFAVPKGICDVPEDVSDTGTIKWK